MALFGFNSRQYEMLMSILPVYTTRRTASCVELAILIDTYQLINDIQGMPIKKSIPLTISC